MQKEKDGIIILYKNDHKGKPQSVEVEFNSGTDANNNYPNCCPTNFDSLLTCNLHAYGENLPMALENLIDALVTLKDHVTNAVEILENPYGKIQIKGMDGEDVKTFTRVNYYTGEEEVKTLPEELNDYMNRMSKERM